MDVRNQHNLDLPCELFHKLSEILNRLSMSRRKQKVFNPFRLKPWSPVHVEHLVIIECYDCCSKPTVNRFRCTTQNPMLKRSNPLSQPNVVLDRGMKTCLWEMHLVCPEQDDSSANRPPTAMSRCFQWLGKSLVKSTKVHLKKPHDEKKMTMMPHHLQMLEPSVWP